MATAYIIYADDDREFVVSRLIRALPSLCFDTWISSAHLKPPRGRAEVFEACASTLVVISNAASKSPRVRDEIANAFERDRPPIPVRIDETVPSAVEERLSACPGVQIEPGEITANLDALRRELAELLPVVDLDEAAPEGAERIEWNEEIFSSALRDAMGWRDYSRGAALMDAFALHVQHRPYAYPSAHARADLALLRSYRQFALMCRYAESSLETGTRDLRVRRQYGQALIERARFDAAREVLEAVIEEGGPDHPETLEARGLIGRLYKQQYVDAPDAHGAEEHLSRCVETYQSAYEEEPTAPVRFWHGVNAATCRLRAARDGFRWAEPAIAHRIASAILEQIETRMKGENGVEVWELATRVEALVALEEYARAEDALSDYFAHPQMTAFAVSSTHRQFSQVIQIDRVPEGKPLLDRLWQAVARYRTGGLAARAVEAQDSVVEEPVSLLVRVSDPEWQPADVPGLTVHARMGTVVSAVAPPAALQQLMQDPLVISVTESRRAGTSECDKSVPFIKVARDYTSRAGPFQETGERALIAVIDGGIDVLHAAFLDDVGRSRIVGIWDQRHDGGAPEGFGFGTFHSAAQIAEYVRTQTVPNSIGRDPDGHGTHVASIAAGRRAGAFAGGVAPGAPLLVVIASTSESIGYSRAHLSALSFIDRKASELGLPVVVNLSQGMNAGAHDGRSDIEVMFSHFTNGGRAPGRVVVKSAGNERDKRGHAQVPLGPNRIETLLWNRPNGASLPDEEIELWWSAGNEFAFRLAGPTSAGLWSDWVSATQAERRGTLGADGSYVLLLTDSHPDNGDGQLRLRIGDGRSRIASGTWRLQIRSGSVPVDGTIHAWIERGDDNPSTFLNHASEDMTVTIPGTAADVITVGAIAGQVDNAGQVLIEEGPFSSYGPTRDGRCKPELTAPGVGIRAARAGTADQAVARDGTSMAAPHVTGAIALLLSRADKARAATGRPVPGANQIAKALKVRAAYSNAQWTPGGGFGVIDVTALLAVL